MNSLSSNQYFGRDEEGNNNGNFISISSNKNIIINRSK